MEKRLIIELVIIVTLVFATGFGTSQLWGNPQSPNVYINFTAITEIIVSTNPLVTIFGSILASVLVIANLYGILKGYFERRSWKKKYGESRTPVVIKAT